MARKFFYICAGLLCLACGLTPATDAKAAPQFVMEWGASAPGGLDEPYGIAVGGGFAYVSDQFHYRIVKFTLDGQYVGSWGSQGSGPGQFGKTIGLALNGNGRLYVVDFDNSRI